MNEHDIKAVISRRESFILEAYNIPENLSTSCVTRSRSSRITALQAITMSATTYTVEVDERHHDREKLLANNYKLQIAKVVATDSTSTANVVFDSRHIAPTMNVSWDTQYGINFVERIPKKGLKVVAGGTWQACGFGQSYDLDKDGGWIPNNDNPEAKSNGLNVGTNEWTGGGVHVVVGTQDPDTLAWSPVGCILPVSSSI